MNDVGGHLYFMVAENGPIKIGRSSRPDDRLKEVQFGNPWRVTLARIENGNGIAEIDWHKEFAEYAMKGEWFAPNERLYNYLALPWDSSLDTNVDCIELPKKPKIKSINKKARLQMQRAKQGLENTVQELEKERKATKQVSEEAAKVAWNAGQIQAAYQYEQYKYQEAQTLISRLKEEIRILSAGLRNKDILLSLNKAVIEELENKLSENGRRL